MYFYSALFIIRSCRQAVKRPTRRVVSTKQTSSSDSVSAPPYKPRPQVKLLVGSSLAMGGWCIGAGHVTGGIAGGDKSVVAKKANAMRKKLLEDVRSGQVVCADGEAWEVGQDMDHMRQVVANAFNQSTNL